ncbi:uncharacterized protein RHIMIDRAFT_237994 [Rhizopus microsporus ATCC 52813]|uniref:Uncharacterized protein n=1 Tax=Rhizopus microsporus ATCC 52813 TaxID=1340429 RepID=A0A2G4STR4_RHIZD|nr:uncharacterized protein RHIMIDRAFT_237994 [Rhizopus microsporus ATCC 52813]PHZ12177.1 hypothetical protein RHIMIDRAFT_237994 [Rhizopus microsporus ATCC 52813]
MAEQNLSYTPPRLPKSIKSADRSSEIYSKLENEYEMLKQLRAVWVEKLGHLKKQHDILVRMQNVTEEQVKGVNSLYSTELDNDDDTTITTITQNDHLENEESEEEQEEDEEEARRALTLMLEEFGDDMFIDKEDN